MRSAPLRCEAHDAVLAMTGTLHGGPHSVGPAAFLAAKRKACERFGRAWLMLVLHCMGARRGPSASCLPACRLRRIASPDLLLLKHMSVSPMPLEHHRFKI